MNHNLPPRHDIPSYWRSNDESKIFLHLGENPFSPTERVKRAIAEAGNHANRYPDTQCLALRKKIADYVGQGVQSDNIIVGNGSDELIDLAVVSFSNGKAPVSTFSPSFFVYAFAAQRHGIPFVAIPRAEDYVLPALNTLSPEIPAGSYSVTFIANPNNPTGTLTARERLIEYLNRWPGTIVIDECYYEYCGETVIDLIHDYQNLIVLRSLSKSFGLSGLRLGYAVADRKNIDIMERHAMTFPVNICAQAAGMAALEDVEEYRTRIAELLQQRDEMKQRLEQIGLQMLPSHANFVLSVWPESWKDKQPARMLAERGILVSDQTASLNVGRPALRIGIGTREENEIVVAAIQETLSQ